jgi:signal transduction histidine kinase
MSKLGVPALEIMLVEDNPADADLIREALDDLEGETEPGNPVFELVHVERLAAAEERLVTGGIELVLLDLSLPDSQGFDTFRRLAEGFPDLPIVVLSGLENEALAMQAVRHGAQDYLVKGRADADLLGRTLRYSIERKRSAGERARLIREQAEVDAALRARDELVATISHDLKSPLTSIRAQAQLLMRRMSAGHLPTPEDLLERLSRIEQTTIQATSLIDELLEVSRMEAGQAVEMNRAPTDLVALATRVSGDYRSRVEHRRLRFVTTEREIVGMWDATRLERVIGNLIDNALKFSAPDGDVVVTASRDEAGNAILSVSDNGVGIPANDLQHIFVRFYRGRNASGHVAGTGIGLASAQQIVQALGGTLTVESEEGHGSVFTICLPSGEC